MRQQPDIVMIMADQLTALALRAYGHPIVRSPHIDRLAAEGVVFENAYCNFPLCAPSRAALMSGRLATRIGAFDNAAEFAASIPTFAHGLRALGYRTCLSGKMHFVGPDQLHGFEERLTTDIYPADFGWTPHWDAPEERIDWWYHNMMSVKQAGIAEATNQLDFDDEVGFQAERWLSERAREGEGRRPFFLCVSFTHPHDPYAIREEYWNRYRESEIDLPRVPPLPWETMDPHSRRLTQVSDMGAVTITEEDVRRARHAYYGEISYVDDHVGRLMAALRRFGLARDTIVLFTADHGEMLGERGLWYKMHFFEWALRVPLIVTAPGRFAPSRVASPVSLVDVMPTLLDLGGGTPDPVLAGDGASLVPWLEGRPVADRPVLAEYTAEGALAPILMVRDGKLKLIWSEADPPLLFDLARDPHELTNLAVDPAHADELARLTALVHRHWEPKALHEQVLQSQRTRRFAWSAVMTGQYTSWDYQPHTDASRQYMRNHLDLNEVEAGRRFPPPRP
ncbi:choline-sulfatase [Benzoatithermus flavus]|uniref:Choline-sulfatase n=1 Tax=Benzoatithermus flavus TaxID=3108223 RepID=A0ABU8XTA4_9PROT